MHQVNVTMKELRNDFENYSEEKVADLKNDGTMPRPVDDQLELMQGRIARLEEQRYVLCF